MIKIRMSVCRYCYHPPTQNGPVRPADLGGVDAPPTSHPFLLVPQDLLPPHRPTGAVGTATATMGPR